KCRSQVSRSLVMGKSVMQTGHSSHCRGGYGAVNKLESSAIPLLASPQGGVAASSRKFREATEADADGVVFLLFLSENHPVLAIGRCFAIFFDRSSTPPCGDARRGVTLDCSLFTAPDAR